MRLVQSHSAASAENPQRPGEAAISNVRMVFSSTKTTPP